MANMLQPLSLQGPTRGPAAAPPTGGEPKKSFSIADLKQYLHIVVKRIWLVALCFVVSLTVTVVRIVQQDPVYRCRTTLLLTTGLPVPESIRRSTEVAPLGEYIDTQQLIIQSGLLVSRARERLSRPAAEVQGKITSISVYPVGRTAFIAIQVDSLDPVIGAEMANALAEEYLDFKAEERMDTSQATVISLTQQANRLHEELKKADERTLVFIKDNNVIAIQERGNIAASHLAGLSARAASYRTERMFLEAQQPLLAQASDEAVLAALASPAADMGFFGGSSAVSLGGSNALPVPPVAGPESALEYGLVSQGGWPQLKREKALLEARLLEYRKRYRDAHPLIQQTLEALKDNRQSLDLELQFSLRQFYSQLEALAIKEKASVRVEREWEEQALDFLRKSQEYSSIQRNAGRLQGLYDLVFNRLKEVDISVGIEPETVKIMERAQPASSPVSPRKLQSIFMAVLIGLGLGLGLVFGLEYIDDSLRFPEEVAQTLGVPFFGLVPAANWDPDDLRTHMLSNIDQRSGLAEAYRNIRSALLFGAGEDRAKTLVLTSAVPKEGKTTTCLNMAVCLAQAGARVLMVDGDLRRGELHKFFGLEGGRGFSDILIGQAKPEAVIQRTGIPNLDLVATGPFPPNPAEVILRPEFKPFLDYARRTYDRVLFDCPPVLAVSEAGILASMVDGVIMVVWAGQTSRKLSQLAVKLLRERGAVVLGCVLNNLDFGRVGYYYYSTYYGYYDYDYLYEKKTSGSS